MKSIPIPVEDVLIDKALAIADGMQRAGHAEHLEATHILHGAMNIGLEVMYKRWYQADKRPTADLITEAEAELDLQKRKVEAQ